jgi:thioredoxin 1
MLAPVLEELAAEYAGRIKFAKLDIEESEATAQGADISSIPCLILYKDGVERARRLAYSPKPQIKAWIEQQTRNG